MLAYIHDSATDPDHKYDQDILIANMYYASEIRQQVELEQHCHSEDAQNQYKGAPFENNITCIDAIICRDHHHNSTQEPSKQLAINTIGRIDHQSHTSRLNQHTLRLEALKRQVQMLNTALHDNNVGGHSVCNNNDDTRLDFLEGILRQHITSQTQTNNQTNKKFNSLTSYSDNNDNNNNNDEYASPPPSIDQSIDNNVRGHSVRAATNNNVDTRLDYDSLNN